MPNKIQAFFAIPPAIRAEFWKDSMQKNRSSLWIISIMIFGMELFNIARVLFFSTSRLGTLNNRIYFSLYCALLLGAAISLFLQHRLRNAPMRAQLGIQFGSVAFFFLWHILLNLYDLRRNPTAESYVFISALVGLAMFIQMPAACSAAFYTLGYLLFMGLASRYLEMGAIINLTIVAVVATAISITRSHHTVIELLQRREIHRINEHLLQLLQKDPLTGLLNKKAFQDCGESVLGKLSNMEAVVFFMIDVDDFKLVNDQYGHPCGDSVLVEMGRRIQAFFPDARYIGRIGGDEFAVILPAIGDSASMQRGGAQFAKEPHVISWEGKEFHLQCSMGGAWIGRPGVSYQQVYREIDSALYEAKQGGKGRCCMREISGEN